MLKDPFLIFKDQIAIDFLQNTLNEQREIDRIKFEKILSNFALSHLLNYSNPIAGLIGLLTNFSENKDIGDCISESIDKLNSNSSTLKNELRVILAIVILSREATDGIRMAASALPMTVNVLAKSLGKILSGEGLGNSISSSMEEYLYNEGKKELQQVVHYLLTLLLNHVKYNKNANKEDVKKYIGIFLEFAGCTNYIEFKHQNIAQLFDDPNEDVVSFIKKNYYILLDESKVNSQIFPKTYYYLKHKDFVIDRL